MENSIVGILGCGGYIGSNAAEKLLRNGVRVIGGQRSDKELFSEYDNFSRRKVDVSVKADLEAFIDECDIIVNCVSPSHVYGKLVRDAVISAGKILVDPSDASYEKDRSNTEGICVASAGYIPGLSEFLPYVAAKRDFDTIERSVVYQGGFDGCSAGSFVDMIIGAGNEDFCGDAYISKGNIAPLGSDIRKTHSTPFSDKKVIFKPLITCDSRKLAEVLGSDEHYFFCTYDDMATLSFFMRLLVDVTRHSKEEAADIIENKLNERIRTNKEFGSQVPLAFLYMELTGLKNGSRKTAAYKVCLRNVNRVCGYFLAETVLAVLRDPSKLHSGFNYGFELVDAAYEKRILDEIGDDEYIRFEEMDTADRLSIGDITNKA
ncbi:saccharopine dehydrogenase NADP-binding domain-containing protein [Ruminococcus sp.]|uniref:saccharopine dehydrogenase NADP-binding domain-containing protein n=1 Tax=Ruminococcus sp. TaxID=41978 RepID=UPI0025FCB4D2|nr:saccharopine dehydrogenase NADP-binding domain-containing protein [Ruminococcus sp.]MBQ6250292.1 saccharopine dehydrogenase NADP-binding domain-containing protein [Ruminococcus sp.]